MVVLFLINISHKRNEILPFATMWMDLEDIMFSEVSQTEKDKYWIFLIYLCNLKYKANKKIKQLTDTENKLVIRGEGDRGGTR